MTAGFSDAAPLTNNGERCCRLVHDRQRQFNMGHQGPGRHEGFTSMLQPPLTDSPGETGAFV